MKAKPATLDSLSAQVVSLTETVATLADAQTKALAAERLIAADVLDAPVPIRHYFGVYGGRSTFARWKAQGLRVVKIPSMGPAVQPSELKAFLLSKHKAV